MWTEWFIFGDMHVYTNSCINLIAIYDERGDKFGEEEKWILGGVGRRKGKREML